MLDIQYIRENADVVKTACVNKNLDDKIIDKLIKVDEKRRDLLVKVEKFRAESNSNAKKIKEQVHGGGRPDADLVAHGKKVKTQLKEIEPTFKDLEEQYLDLMLQVPNVPADDTPVGPDESGNEIIRTIGDKPNFDFNPLPHHELMEKLDILDTKRAVRIAGFRAYYLKGDGFLLEQALLRYAMDLLVQEGFTPMTVPVMVNKEAMVGTGYFPWGAEDHYKTQDGQILTGTAEVSLTAYYMGETLAEKDLPIQIAGVSPCFRREIGAHGKDTAGIVRVHQFNKVEQVVYTVADEEETRKWHDKMAGLSEQLLTDLGLSYQVLAMCTGDMGAGQRKKYDIETWFPSQEKYRETHSASYFNDFQSRRLNIRYQAKDGSLKHVYTLNNTMAASPRMLAAIIENYQTAEGTIRVPEVLQPYMGKEEIK
ncbi:MAG: serine--tRNA ligase [Candidatus Pacebacteria bacterium]|nr:serine--tRNA ligase [Candidatus Paceibacterota bacterium]